MARISVGIGIALAFLGGCAAQRQASTSGPPPSLEGTSWRLIRFQSSGLGTIVPPNVQNYTLQFLPDGQLNMQLDCNSGNAKWRASPSPTGGSLMISPKGTTRATCTPGAIDTRLAYDLVRVRSYSFRDGQLSLALEENAGAYLWEPMSK